MIKRSLILLITVAVAIAVIPGRVCAQESTVTGPSACLHFSGDSPDLLVQLRSGVVLSGTVPLTICGLEPGLTYDLTVRGRGFEVRQGYLSIDKNGKASVRGNRLGTFARNIVPGLGSMHAGRNLAGWSDLIDLVFSGMMTWREQNEYLHIENRFTIQKEQLAGADNVEEKQRIQIEVSKTSRDLNIQNAHRKRCLGYTGYLYAFQLIDPWIVGNPPKSRVTAGGSVVEITGAGTSTAKAAILSILRPGRGQFYQGKNSRGIFYSIAATAGVLVALDQLNLYEEAVNAYEINLEYFYQADTVEDKEYFQSRSSEYWADVDKTRRWRNISYGVLAGIWAAGVIDTFIPGQDDAPPSDISFNIGPTHASLMYRF